MFEWWCGFFGHRFKMNKKMSNEDDIFFTYSCRNCGVLKFVTKQKFPKAKQPFYQ